MSKLSLTLIGNGASDARIFIQSRQAFIHQPHNRPVGDGSHFPVISDT